MNTIRRSLLLLLCEQVVSDIHYLIDNIFVTLGGLTFRQTIGIPMGTDCAPLLAELFLFTYEHDFMLRLRREPHKACQFSSTARYIDDLIALNNPDFAEHIRDIYPPELELKRTNGSSDAAPYLDLDIAVVEGKFIMKVYDKRDAFNFDIVNFPHLSSNIPRKPAYGVYISQLLRLAKACDHYEDFLERHRTLSTRLLKQGFKYNHLCGAFRRFYCNHQRYLYKYDVPMKQHVLEGIPLPLPFLPRTRCHITTRR